MCVVLNTNKRSIEEHIPMQSSSRRIFLNWKQTRAAADYYQGQYVIPVVFHVFGEPTNDTRLKVTYSLIEKALKQTSEDFQGLTADYDQTEPVVALKISRNR